MFAYLPDPLNRQQRGPHPAAQLGSDAVFPEEFLGVDLHYPVTDLTIGPRLHVPDTGR